MTRRKRLAAPEAPDENSSTGGDSSGQTKPARKRRLTQNTYLWGVINDIETLVGLRHGAIEGRRNVVLFHYTSWFFALTGSEPDTLAVVLALNASLVPPLTEGECAKIVRSAARGVVDTETGEVKARRFRTENVIRTLGITEGEQRSMRILIGRDERLRRKREREQAKRRANGSACRSQVVEEIRQALKANPSATDVEIAKALGVNRKTVAKYRKTIGDE